MSKGYKLPKNAKKVFRGVIFDTYQWQQKMFDGTYQTFEMLKRPDTVQIIPILDNGKILTSKQRQPKTGVFTTLFGGRVDEGEEALQAAKRELLEESGYTAKDYKLLMKFNPVTKMDWTIYYYVAKDCKKVSEGCPDCGEKINLKEISFEEFLDLPDDPTFKSGEFENFLLKTKNDKKKREELRKIFYG